MVPDPVSLAIDPNIGSHAKSAESETLRVEPNQLFLKSPPRDFSGGPVVKTRVSSAGSMDLIPGWGSKIPYAIQCDQKINIKNKSSR